MTADRDDLAAILAKHHYLPLSYLGECRCGNWQGPRDLHRAHVAQMVLESDWLRGVKAEVWEEGYEDCLAGDACRCHSNPYRADRVDAEDGGR